MFPGKKSAMTDFRYRAIVIDDKVGGSRNYFEKRTDWKLDFETFTSVDDCLKRIFKGISDPTGSTHHDFDLVFLDFDLGEKQNTKYPGGGLSLYPLFTHSYRSGKPGDCVVCTYSDVLHGTRGEFCRLFELCESLRLGSAFAVSSVAFDKLDLSQPIKQRAESLLRASPSEAIREIYNLLVRGGIEDFVEATQQRLSVLSRLCSADVTPAKLRPDFNNPNLWGSGEMPAFEDQAREIVTWLGELVSDSNYAHTASDIYHFNPSDGTDLPDIYSWAHVPNKENDSNDPRPYIHGNSILLDRPYSLHPYHIQALMAIEAGEANRRCSEVHRAFRLSLIDTAEQRYEEGNSSRPYDKGYFLLDVIANDYDNKFNLSPINVPNGGYVYVPLVALRDILSDLCAQTQVESPAYQVIVSENRMSVAFILPAGEMVSNEAVVSFAKRSKHWAVGRKIADWGELVVCTYEDAFLIYGETLWVDSDRFGSSAFALPDNSYCLIFPMEEKLL
jgi:hypothetical protein